MSLATIGQFDPKLSTQAQERLDCLFSEILPSCGELRKWLRNRRKKNKDAQSDFDPDDGNALLVIVIKLLESR